MAKRDSQPGGSARTTTAGSRPGTPGSRPGAPGNARSRQRAKPVQVQAKRPWGFIAGATVLALLLIGVVVYAATNQGSGSKDALTTADSNFDGLVKADPKTLTRNHVEGPVQYPTTPPQGGNHSAVWENCGVYAKPVANENAVHSLEHGAVWVTYLPDLPSDQVATLAARVKSQSYALLSPDPAQKSKIELTAWGRQLAVSSASDPRVATFISTYAEGPQTPERGAACSGGTSATGTTPVEPTGTAPAPASSSAG
jgi:hypothetical protein